MRGPAGAVMCETRDLGIKIFVTGTHFQACENFFRLPNRTRQDKVVASQADCAALLST